MKPLDVDAISLHFAPDLVDCINNAGLQMTGYKNCELPVRPSPIPSASPANPGIQRTTQYELKAEG
jgi:hypothetical protein